VENVRVLKRYEGLQQVARDISHFIFTRSGVKPHIERNMTTHKRHTRYTVVFAAEF
jgi:hypothetical protein